MLDKYQRLPSADQKAVTPGAHQHKKSDADYAREFWRKSLGTSGSSGKKLVGPPEQQEAFLDTVDIEGVLNDDPHIPSGIPGTGRMTTNYITGKQMPYIKPGSDAPEPEPHRVGTIASPREVARTLSNQRGKLHRAFGSFR